MPRRLLSAGLILSTLALLAFAGGARAGGAASPTPLPQIGGSLWPWPYIVEDHAADPALYVINQSTEPVAASFSIAGDGGYRLAILHAVLMPGQELRDTLSAVGQGTARATVHFAPLGTPQPGTEGTALDMTTTLRHLTPLEQAERSGLVPLVALLAVALMLGLIILTRRRWPA
jgi:hypothetical protein